MAKIRFHVNGLPHTIEVDPSTPLLWVLRDHLNLTGTKYGCGQSLCGACTVHVDGRAVRSCVQPISGVAGKMVTTIEGLSTGGRHPLQIAWCEEGVPQCGYCQAGQIMQAADLLQHHPSPSVSEIHAAMAGNLCRCGTYPRIVRAIRRAAQKQRDARENR